MKYYAGMDVSRKRRRSGLVDETGAIVKEMRAATLLVRSTKWSSLRAWGMEVARRRGMARARVAVARKLGVILHRMWRDDADFRFGTAPTAAAA
jgi:transposase